MLDISIGCNHPGILLKHGMHQSVPFFFFLFLIFMSCHYFSSILFFCNKMHLCFEKCLTHFVQARGALHKVAPGQNRCYSLSPFVCTVSLHRLNTGTRAFTVYCLAWRCPPQVLHQRQLKQRQWGDSISRFKEGKKDKSFRLGFCSNMPRRCDHNPFFHSLCFRTKASGCDRESDFLCRLFMQLNHYNSSNLK